MGGAVSEWEQGTAIWEISSSQFCREPENFSKKRYSLKKQNKL